MTNPNPNPNPNPNQVKLAQMIAEDARVPASYRKLLGSLRDENETMSAAALWHTLPHTVWVRVS